MRIGELARRLGVSPDTVRFYERSGSLPRPPRGANDYREYGEGDVEHLRLLIDLRRLDLPLAEAAQVAGWCHSGHCTDASAHLPGLVADRRAEIARRIASLNELDARLAAFDRHVAAGRRSLAVVGSAAPCCDAASAVLASAEGGCTCCAAPREGVASRA